MHRHIRNVRTTHEGDIGQFHQTRNHITQNFQAGVTVAYGSSSFPANTLELAGIYAEDLGSQRIRIGPSALKPVIIVSQASPYSVQAQTGQTLTVPSATATDPLTGNSLSVTANPATVSLSSLASHVVTYSCQTSAGDLSSALLTIVVQDSSSPVVTLLGASSVSINVGDTYGSAEDAGATASDNLDGDLTSSIVTTGLPVDSSTAGTKTVQYTVTDSQNLSASITRSVVVAPPWSTVQVLYGTDTYSTTAAPYNPFSLSVALLSHGYGSNFSAYMGPRTSYAGSAGDITDPGTLWGNRGSQKHVGVWYDTVNENTSGYASPVHLTYDFGASPQIRVTAGQCAFAQWGTNGTVTFEGSTDASSWNTIHTFTAGTGNWRNQAESYTPYTFTVPSASVTPYRYYRIVLLKTGTGFEAAIHSLIITGQAKN